MHTYFIGYDAREHEAAGVCAFSIRRRSKTPVRIYLLEHQMLRTMDLFNRPWLVNPDGQFYDERDGKPFSTAFSHSRFLVFHLARELGCTDSCMFVDCDFLFLEDPSDLMREQKLHQNRIGVVSRTRTVDENSTKMDGMIQQNYHRKLWSAMFTFTPSDDLATIFRVNSVNHNTGRALHAFLNRPDECFWDINPRWHFIPSLDAADTVPKAIHYSEFSPWLNPERGNDHPYSFGRWYEERDLWLAHAAETGKLLPVDNLEQALKKAAQSG